MKLDLGPSAFHFPIFKQRGTRVTMDLISWYTSLYCSLQIASLKQLKYWACAHIVILQHCVFQFFTIHVSTDFVSHIQYECLANIWHKDIWCQGAIDILIMIKKCEKLFEIEGRRYKKKGLFNIILAFGLYFGVMYATISLGRAYWPRQIEDKTMFVNIWSIGLNLGMSLVSFMLYLPGYMGWSQYFADKLVNKKSSRPWERKNWPQVRSKTIINFIINQMILYPLLVYLVNRQGIQLRFQNFPSYFEFILQILFIYYFQDVIFYFFHRTVHYGALYKIHKVHHEYDTLYTWVATYLHPLDYAFANLLPGAFPLVILGSRLHCFTFFYWIVYKMLLSFENHSGYEFQWSPFRIFPFIANTSHHDNHHSQNVGNFGGSCYFWDFVFDTYVKYSPDI